MIRAPCAGEALAGRYLIGHLGMSVPVILLGVLLRYVAIDAAIIAFGALTLVPLGVAGAMVAVTRRAAAARPVLA